MPQGGQIRLQANNVAGGRTRQGEYPDVKAIDPYRCRQKGQRLPLCELNGTATVQKAWLPADIRNHGRHSCGENLPDHALAQAIFRTQTLLRRHADGIHTTQ